MNFEVILLQKNVWSFSDLNNCVGNETLILKRLVYFTWWKLQWSSSWCRLLLFNEPHQRFFSCFHKYREGEIRVSRVGVGVLSFNFTVIGTILEKTYRYFFTFYHNLSSPHVKRNKIIFTRKWMYELPHELPIDLRPWGN